MFLHEIFKVERLVIQTFGKVLPKLVAQIRHDQGLLALEVFELVGELLS